MSSNKHPTDASGTRDLVKENQDIHVNAAKTKTDSFVPTKTKIAFTSLAQAKIPNFAAEKLLGNNIKVTYVPDFYYIVSLSQKMFILAKQDKSLAKIDTLSMYSFTLYVCYSLMYVYLDTVNQVNPSIDVDNVLNIFSRNGYNDLAFPSLMSQWITGLGKHIDTEIKRIFVPYIPQPVENGDYFDNYFLSADTAHLLPNFRLMHLLILHQNKSTTLNIPNALKPAYKIVGNPFAGIAPFSSIFIARQNAYKVPGCTALLKQVDDPQIIPLLLSNLARIHADPIERFLMLDSNLLLHLKIAVEPLFREIDVIKISSISPAGSSFTMISIVMDDNQDIKTENPAIPADPNLATAETDFEDELEMNARIKSRSELINGNVDYASLTPIVRVSNNTDAIVIGNHQFVDPQHAWFTESIEYSTRSFTMYEGQTYFQRTT